MIDRGYHQNGQLWYERPLHDGLRHGIIKWWWSNGQLQSELPYHQGQLHGIAKSWYKNGQLQYELQHHEGQKHGISKWWNRDRGLERKEYYLYNNEVTKEEYRKHELIKKLSGL